MHARIADEFERQVSCEGKDGFTDLRRAQEVAERSRRRKGTNVQPYKCVMCGNWHIGSHIKRPANWHP